MTIHLKRTRSDGVVVEQPVTRLALGDGLGLIEVNGVVTLTVGNSQQTTPETAAVTIVTSASTTAGAGLIVPHGTAPTGAGLVNGGVWSTTAGFFARVNGATSQFVMGVPLGPTQGGTGLTTYATGDTLYASAANTLAKLAIGTVGKILRSNGTIPTWSTLTLPDTLAAGRVLITTGTDVVGGLAPTANRVLVADGSTATFTTLPFAAMPAVTGTWDVGAGNTITFTREATFSNLLIVAVGGVMRLSYRADPAGPSNGDCWVNSTSFELKYRANGVTYRVVGITP